VTTRVRLLRSSALPLRGSRLFGLLTGIPDKIKAPALRSVQASKRYRGQSASRSIPTSTARSVRSSSQSIRSSAKTRLVLCSNHSTIRAPSVFGSGGSVVGSGGSVVGSGGSVVVGGGSVVVGGGSVVGSGGSVVVGGGSVVVGGGSVLVGGGSVLVGGGVGEGEGPGEGTGDGPGPGFGPGGGWGSFPTDEPSPPTRYRTPPLVSTEKSATAEGPLPGLAPSFAAPPCASPSPSGSNAT
jgi:hypothetical protein